MFFSNYRNNQQSMNFLSPNKGTGTNGTQSSFGSSGTTQNNDLVSESHTTLSDLPTDTVSKLKFSPVSDFLACTSWDKSVRIWQVNSSMVQASMAIKNDLQFIPLDACWHDTGNNLFLAGCDNAVHMWDLGSNQITKVAEHSAPVRSCFWISSNNSNVLLTGSWDKTLKLWDMRSNNPIKVVNLPGKVIDMAFGFPYVAVSMEENKIQIYSLRNGNFELYHELSTSFGYQNRSLCMMTDKNGNGTGFVVGAVSGIVAVYKNIEKIGQGDYTYRFRCHRTPIDTTQVIIYQVNDAVSPHRNSRYLFTGGGDKKLYLWDINEKRRCKVVASCELPITAMAIDRNDGILAFSSGYDWAEGAKSYRPATMKPSVCITKLNLKS